MLRALTGSHIAGTHYFVEDHSHMNANMNICTYIDTQHNKYNVFNTQHNFSTASYKSTS